MACRSAKDASIAQSLIYAYLSQICQQGNQSYPLEGKMALEDVRCSEEKYSVKTVAA